MSSPQALQLPVVWRSQQAPYSIIGPQFPARRRPGSQPPSPPPVESPLALVVLAPARQGLPPRLTLGTRCEYELRPTWRGLSARQPGRVGPRASPRYGACPPSPVAVRYSWPWVRHVGLVPGHGTTIPTPPSCLQTFPHRPSSIPIGTRGQPGASHGTSARIQSLVLDGHYG